MSKLDYITAGIVALCLVAIVFLVYKMTDLFKSDKPIESTEVLADTVETEDDDVYDYELKDDFDSTGVSHKSTQPGASTPATSTKPSTTEAKPAEPATTTPVEKTKTTSKPAPTHSSAGRFLVLAGSFRQKSLAEQEANRLKKLGYHSARVEIFDKGKFAVILVDRFDNMAEAERLVKKLKGDKVEAYIKMKETGK